MADGQIDPHFSQIDSQTTDSQTLFIQGQKDHKSLHNNNKHDSTNYAQTFASDEHESLVFCFCSFDFWESAIHHECMDAK